MNLTPDVADRVAFIFNLNELRHFGQRLNSRDTYQTCNSVDYGPTFGGGFDLATYRSLNVGNNNVYSDGAENDCGTQLISGTVGGQTLTLGQIDVFTITPGTAPPPVPEPPTYALLLASLALVVAGARRRRAV